MNNRDLFRRDPQTANLVNDGQARILDESDSEQAVNMLRYELEHFVCEGQYAAGLDRILGSFLANLGNDAQRAAWVSGFYGSGKSHLLKMLGHLWVNTPFADGTTARQLAPDLPADMHAHFRELDTAGKRNGGGVFAVSGTMPEGTGESARLTVLGIIFRGCGLPFAYNQARFCLYLRKQGFLEKFEAHIKNAGRDFRRELADFYVSPFIRKALLECDSGLGDEKEARELLRSQFPNQRDVDTAEFVRVATEVLRIKGNGEIPLTAVILDEVQHYIGDSKERSRDITDLTEALNKQMKSRILVVAAGQNALSTDTPQFSWLRDRFTIPVELSDADVETVTRKVLLAKKAESIATLKADLDKNAGEIERHLAKSNIGHRASDRNLLVTDYPILPTRRRFWEAALHAVDPTGRNALLRTQLRITHEALRQVAAKPLGHVIPADFMFFQQQTALVQQGVLSREISNRISRLETDDPKSGKLKARICGLVYLIRKLSRDKGIDKGVRATEEMLADLLVENLSTDGAFFRHNIPSLLKELVDATVLMFDGTEYNLQTRESAEWEENFKTQFTKVRNDTIALLQERKKRLRAAVEESLRKLVLRQGVDNTSRDIQLHFGTEAPAENGQVVPVWVCDGWEVSEKTYMQGKAREAGSNSPVLFVILPQVRHDVLTESLARMKAAQAVLDLKGVPTSAAAEEARSVIEARRNDSERTVAGIISDILGAARVYKGGGTEMNALELIDKIKDGAEDALKRLFPRFDEADQKGWEAAANRARNGDESPMQAIGWRNATEEHPVCREILASIGSGKEGRHILASFHQAPFGWNKDVVHGALVCLCAAGALTATDTQRNEPLPPKQLDHPRISKAAFRRESVSLTAKERIEIKGIFQKPFGILCKPNDDLCAKAAEYFTVLTETARKAGGDAPLPPRPSTAIIDDLRRTSGNEQLAGILAQKTVLEQLAADSKTRAELSEKRLPLWQKLNDLLACGNDLAALDSVRVSAGGIHRDRLLLDTTDHVTPLIRQAADQLRATLTASRTAYAGARTQSLARLETSDVWQRLASSQRDQLLAQTPIPDADTSPIATEDDLLAALRATGLAQWHDRTYALDGRVDKLLAEAAHLLEPKAQRLTLPAATLRTPEDLDRWLATTRATIEEKLKSGPVIL